MDRQNRSGRFVAQPTGYRAFVPKPLPPDPPLEFTSELLGLLSEADRKLGRLDGVTQVLPDPDLFVSMYVKKEALLSSQIEGTQASLEDVIAIEAVSYTHLFWPSRAWRASTCSSRTC